MLVLALVSQQHKVGAELVCYTEMQSCKSGNVTIIRGETNAAVKECCVSNGGKSYRTYSGEGCTSCVVYGFFASVSDNKLLSNTSVGEGRPALTVYFGLLKGMLPAVRRVQFKADTLYQGQGSQKYIDIVPAALPYLTSQFAKLSVKISASSDNVAQEDSNVIRIIPQLSSTGDNEFVTPLTVAVLHTNVMAVNFSCGAYYVTDDSSKAVVTITRGKVVSAKPLRFRLVFLELEENETNGGAPYIGNVIGDTTFLFSKEPEYNVSIDISRFNTTSIGFAVKLQLEDITQASYVDLTGRNLTYVYFNENITVGFTVSEMTAIVNQRVKICVSITHPLLGMEPVTMKISSATHSDVSDTVTLSEKNQMQCITRDKMDTAHVGMVVYKLSASMNTKQPLEVFPDALTVRVAEKDNIVN